MNPEENEVKDERLQHQEEGADDEVSLFLEAEEAQARLKTGSSTLVFLHRLCFVTMVYSYCISPTNTVVSSIGRDCGYEETGSRNGIRGGEVARDASHP